MNPTVNPLPQRNLAGQVSGELIGQVEGSRCPYQRMIAGEQTRACGLPVMASTPAIDLPTPTVPSIAAPGTVVLVGVNHHTAPVELRERFYNGGELAEMLTDLRNAGLAEAAVLFTCNRFEVYGTIGTSGLDAILDDFAKRCGMSAADLRPSLYIIEGADVALHLMRVAAGLESIVLGEPQILGQVSDALAYAKGAKAIGPLLTRVFTTAIHAGKRARTETDIGRHTLSISHAAVLLLKAERDPATTRVLVVGAGEMATLAIKALQAHGARSITLVNRTAARGEALARRFGIASGAWDELPELLHDVDAVIVATSSPTPIITADHVARRRSRESLELVDLSVPRNVEDACGSLPGVRLHVVDDLQQVVESHRIRRQREAARVEELLEEELADYLDWTHGRTVAPLIVELRQTTNTLVDGELERTLARLPQLDEDARELVAQLAKRIGSRLLHSATVALKTRGCEGERDA